MMDGGKVPSSIFASFRGSKKKSGLLFSFRFPSDRTLPGTAASAAYITRSVVLSG